MQASVGSQAALLYQCAVLIGSSAIHSIAYPRGTYLLEYAMPDAAELLSRVAARLLPTWVKSMLI